MPGPTCAGRSRRPRPVITAVDTNVLLDVFTNDATLGARSLAALRACLAEVPVIARDVVSAEIVAAFSDPARREPGARCDPGHL